MEKIQEIQDAYRKSKIMPFTSVANEEQEKKKVEEQCEGLELDDIITLRVKSVLLYLNIERKRRKAEKFGGRICKSEEHGSL